MVFHTRTRHYVARGVRFGVVGVVLLRPRVDANPLVIVYAAVLLCVPPLLRRFGGVRLTPAYDLWLTIPIGLHVAGSVYGLYDAVWWWDHLTHALSATLVSAGAYALVTVVNLRQEGVPDEPYPRRVATLAMLLAATGLWEFYELFVPGRVDGPADTAADVAFNVVGWALAVGVDTRHLDGLTTDLTARLGEVTGRSRDDPYESS